ncbi:MAG: hypothetical protein QOJ79_410 [Actinomycetota bacterium]|nr:hypothetical protein [Actinomycetota bacterium]
MPADEAPGAVRFYGPNMTGIGDLLRQRATTDPDRDLVRFGTASVTVAVADARSTTLAHGLVGKGVRPGDRVVLALPNGLDFPLLWLAAAKAGAVVVPVSPTSGSHDLGHVLADSGAVLVVSDVPRPGCGVPVLRPAELLTAPAVPLPVVDRADVMSLQYTSGTTGLPKACVLTHDYWLALGETVAALSRLTADDVLLTAQSCSYIDPQWNLLVALQTGAPLVVLPRFSPSTFWDSVVETGATFCYLVGAMPLFLLQQPERPAVERGHRLRLVVCSGIDPALHATFEQRWAVPWREAFGMTETGVDLAVPVEDTDSVGCGWLGVPAPGKEVRVDEGELLIRGRPMFRGYWNRPSPFDVDGWFRTGDLVQQDDVGRLRLVGRKKDMVRRAGENIAAAEVEAVLVQHPSVAAAAVVPEPDRLRGEEVKAYVQPRPEQQIDPAELVAFVAGRLARFKVPRYVEVVDALPLTPSSRVAKHLLVSDPLKTYDARAVVTA